MAFKVRDLMIDVAPGVREARVCCPGTVISYCHPTYIDWRVIIQHIKELETLIWQLPNCYKTVIPAVETIAFQTPAVNQPGMVANPQNLAQLKAQLRQSLAQVEAQEQAMAESLKPQTLEEAEMLEQKLTEALDELRNHKEELRRSNR